MRLDVQTTDFHGSYRDMKQLHRVLAHPSRWLTGHRTADNQCWFLTIHKKAQLMQGLRAARQRRHFKMAVRRHLGFYRTGNSAIWSPDPENPSLDTIHMCDRWTDGRTELAWHIRAITYMLSCIKPYQTAVACTHILTEHCYSFTAIIKQ